MSALWGQGKLPHTRRRTHQASEVNLKCTGLQHHHWCCCCATPSVRIKARGKWEDKTGSASREKSSIPFNCATDIFAFESGSEITLTVPGKAGVAGAAAAFTAQTWPLPAGTWHPAATAHRRTGQKQGYWHHKFHFTCACWHSSKFRSSSGKWTSWNRT